MALERIVGQGEHISQIAEEAGYGSIEPILEAEQNSDLFARRPNPHQLVPGDVLLLPTKEPQPVTVPVDQVARIVLRRERVRLRVKVLDYFGEPVAGETGRLTTDQDDVDVTTDAGGLLDVPIARVTLTAKLQIGGMLFHLQVGSLQPIDEVNGVRARLNNLGFWSGEQTGFDVGSEGDFKLGIELFQEELGDKPDGILTDALRGKVLAEHGQ